MKYHALGLSIIYSTSRNENQLTEMLKIYNYFKNISKDNISQEFRLKEIDETNNYFIEEIKQDESITLIWVGWVVISPPLLVFP